MNRNEMMNDEDKTTDDVRGAATTTPVTTGFVRRHYSMGSTAYTVDGSIARMPTARDVEYAGRQFDEWLARHDAEVRDALTPRPTGPCPERYPDPADDVQCWLTSGHEGQHIVDGGTYRWSTPPADAVREALYEILRFGNDGDEMDTVSRILKRFDVRPRGTVTEAEVAAAQQSLLADHGWLRESIVRAALEAAREVRP